MSRNGGSTFVHAVQLFEDFGISWLSFGACYVLVQADAMLWVDVISFNVIIHPILINHSEWPRLQSNFDKSVIATSVEVYLLLKDFFVNCFVNPFFPILRLIFFLVKMKLLK